MQVRNERRTCQQVACEFIARLLLKSNFDFFLNENYYKIVIQIHKLFTKVRVIIKLKP